MKENVMKKKRIIQIWGMLLIVLLSTLWMLPASAAYHANKQTTNIQATSINATIYLKTATLQPIFQGRIDQQIPNAVNSAIRGIVGNLPAADQGWAYEMAGTLLQPSATLTSLVPQQGGLAASLRMSLYPGDPKPINAKMLVKFSVLNASTIQVSAQPLNGSPALVSGPLTTLQMPVGQLNSIRATPGCGTSALAVNLQFPVTLGQGATQASGIAQSSQASTRLLSYSAHTQAASGTEASIEIPASSLSSLAGSMGTLAINNNMNAKNIQLSVRGGQIVITSDIMLGTSLKLGTATTYVEPRASGGNLAVHVLKTNLTVLSIFTFPENSYDQQIQQLLNSKLSGALMGKFQVSTATIGGNGRVPCAAGSSLILTGTTNVL
jgi:hypothetical protein